MNEKIKSILTMLIIIITSPLWISRIDSVIHELKISKRLRRYE